MCYLIFFCNSLQGGSGVEELAEHGALGLQDVVLVALPVHHAVGEEGDVVADTEHGIHVVGVDHGGDVVLAGDVVDELVDEDGGLRVEARVGFVAEEVARVERDGTGDGDALLHAARQLGGHLLVRTLQVDTVEAEVHAFANLGVGLFAEHAEGKGNVLLDRHRIEEGRALEQHADLLANLLHLLVLQFRDVAPVVEDFPLLGLVEADEAFEQHGLARPRLPDDEVVDARLEGAVDALEHRLFAERLM